VASVSTVLPLFLVEIGGRRLSGSMKALISEFTYEEREKQSAECKVTLVGPAGSRIDKLLPKRGDKFRARWGYPGNVTDTGELRVHSVHPHYGEETTILITAKDRGHDLGRAGGHQVWENTEIGHVVEDLARSAGLEAVLPRNAKGDINGITTTRTVSFDDVDGFRGRAPFQVLQLAQVPSAPHEAKLLTRLVNLSQRGRSPRELLQSIASQVGCELHVADNKLHLLPKHYGAAPSVVLRWKNGRGALLEFGPKEHRGGKKEKGARGVHAAGVNPDTGQPFAVRVDEATAKGRPVLGRESNFGGQDGDGNSNGGDTVWVDSKNGGDVVRRGPAPRTGAAAQEEQGTAGAFLPTPSGRAEDAEGRARAKHHDAEGGGVKSTFKTVGIPAIRKGRVIQVLGLDRRSSGSWMVIAATHRISATYETSGEVRRHGQNTVGKNRKPTTGQANAQGASTTDRKPQVLYRVDSRNGGEIVGTVVR
jgi:phage protein D